jgi:membrane-anchored glycerophosphoryl diester phosphodiesterase (GDPDase)
MATMPTRELKIGAIIEKTMTVIEHNALPALIFVAALVAVQCPITYFTVTAGALSKVAVTLLTIVISVVASYLLLTTMIRRTGLLSRTKDDVFLTYFGLAILSAMAILVGMILLIIPALFLMARWSIAQPLVVARGDGVKQAFAESWQKTSGSEFQIIIAVLVLIIPLTAISILCGVLLDKASVVGIVVAQIATSGASVASVAMGVALYGMIVGVPKVAAPAA